MIFIDFQYQSIAIDYYWLLLILWIIDFHWLIPPGSLRSFHLQVVSPTASWLLRIRKNIILHFLFQGQHVLRTRNDIYCISFQHLGHKEQKIIVGETTGYQSTITIIDIQLPSYKDSKFRVKKQTWTAEMHITTYDVLDYITSSSFTL